MRKVWLSLITIAALTLAVALPGFAAVPGCRNNNNFWLGNSTGKPGLTQPAFSSIPANCPQNKIVSGAFGTNIHYPQPGMNDLFQKLLRQFNGFGNRSNNVYGNNGNNHFINNMFSNGNCPYQFNSNYNF